jgi:hypothetical protein
LTLVPDLDAARENLCLTLLAQGHYAEGFPLYDVRFTRAVGRVPTPALPFPQWAGEPIAGRSLMVWSEQGFGDQIMFARFIPQLVELGARVTMVVPPALAPVFRRLPAEIVPAAPTMSLQRHDFWAMPGSLPARLGVTLETLPAAPYLGGAAQGEGIGVVTRGDPRHHNDRHRSLPPDLAAELLALPGAVSLHPDDTGARDFGETADRIARLSLVIAVDTSVVHLAGAMGKPVWVLLPAHATDWRWMRGRSDSPWYPSARLFRQPSPGDWASVLVDVRQALASGP